MKKIIFSLLFLMLLTSFLSAQENNFEPLKFGMGVSKELDIFDSSDSTDELWINGFLHITPSIAIRPQFLIKAGEVGYEDIENDIDVKDDSLFSFGIGTDLLYYQPLTDNLFLYAGPFIQYYLTYHETDYSDDTGETDDIYLLRTGIKIGSQFMISSHFGLFGDLGLGYVFREEDIWNWDTDGNPVDDYMITTNKFSTCGARLGAIYYFN